METNPKVLSVQMPFLGGRVVPTTAQHFLTYRAEESGIADGTYWIRRIPHPILMVRDEGDAAVPPFEPYMLLSAARAPGSLVPNVDYVLLPNQNGTNAPGGHGFRDNLQPLANTITVWLQDQGL